MSASPIQVVLVLYRVPLAESSAYTSFRDSGGFRLLVCDNTPREILPIPRDFKGRYVRQPDNPGLATSYNVGLQEAQKNGCPWLLLLDQDTRLTPEYLQELCSNAASWLEDTSLAAVVPKLIENGIVQSPHAPIRLRRAESISMGFCGVAPVDWNVYNSGAMLRVETLQSIGGFPRDFWLDFLDHATFHLLRSGGGRVWVMNAGLQHALSSNEAPRKDHLFLARKHNVREAENLYYRRYGSAQEMRWYRRRTLLDIAVALRHLDVRTAAHQLRMLLRSTSRKACHG